MGLRLVNKFVIVDQSLEDIRSKMLVKLSQMEKKGKIEFKI